MLDGHNSEDVLVSGNFGRYRRLNNSPCRSPDSERPSLSIISSISFSLWEYLFPKGLTGPTEEMERDPTASDSLFLFHTFLDTLLQLFIFQVLKASIMEEGKLQGLTMAKDVMCGHMQHPPQWFKTLLSTPYPIS